MYEKKLKREEQKIEPSGALKKVAGF